MVGILKGLFSSVPGLGMQTLLVGLTFGPYSRLSMSFKRAAGDRDLTPSTPAVFWPWFSWVTLPTAITLADQDLISSFWSLWTNATLLQRDPRSIRFCNLKIFLSLFRQGRSPFIHRCWFRVHSINYYFPLAHPLHRESVGWFQPLQLTVLLLTQSHPGITWFLGVYVLVDYLGMDLPQSEALGYFVPRHHWFVRLGWNFPPVGEVLSN